MCPGGMTSRDVVNRVQRLFPRKTKLGHTGTLDPLATGVLVVCVGAATRLADYVQAMGKSYTSRFRLGATSTTDDADGEVTETPDAVPPTREQIDAALAAFVGTIDQTPPAFSALKVAGARAHDLARQEPERLRELQRLFLIEAAKHNVLPLDDRAVERANPDLAGRPLLAQGRRQRIYSEIGQTLRVTAEGEGGATDAAIAALETRGAVIEGLGLLGAGAHSNDAEYIFLNSIEPRLYLLSRMILQN